MSEQVAELSQTVGGNEYLGRLEHEMDRRLAEAAQTKRREKTIFKDAIGR